MQNKKKLSIVSVVIVLLMGALFLRYKPIKMIHLNKQTRVEYSKEVIEKIAYELSQPIDQTEKGIEAHRAFKRILLNQNESKFLYLATRSILLNIRGGTEAARYVALLPTMFSTHESQYILTHDSYILNQNASQILSSLEQNRDVIFADPTLHQALLNLVNHLEIPVSYKMPFYVSTLFRPLELEKSGVLSSRSQSFEMSLLFMKNAGVSGASLSEAMEKLNIFLKNKEERMIVREKIASIYPEFQNLFL